jgi:hypothetical protein
MHFVYHPKKIADKVLADWLRFTVGQFIQGTNAVKCFGDLYSYLIHDIAASHLNSEHVVMKNLPPFPSNGWWCIGGGGGGGGKGWGRGGGNRKQL